MEDLELGDAVKRSGKKLIDHSLGMHRVEYSSARTDTILIAVHGFDSRGYEWIYPLITMAKTGYQTYFYRWDWTNCPQEAASEMKIAIAHILTQLENFDHLIIFGHSYGGTLVAALAALELDISVEFHVVAAPLTSHPRLKKMCPEFPGFSTAELQGDRFIQWRTRQEQDGAYRDLLVDPQRIDIPGSLVILLPDSADGHRLGHNWSISWVMDSFFEKQ